MERVLVPKPARKRPVKSFAQIEGAPVLRMKAKSDIAVWRKRQLVSLWFRACGSTCRECGCEMIRPESAVEDHPPNLATIDHIRARCLGGTNARGNLRVICNACNAEKSRAETQELPDYLQARKRMLKLRAAKAAKTRARNRARDITKAAKKAYFKAKARGASEAEACSAAVARRAEWENRTRAAA
jgi:hypothetical protein